MFSSSVCWEGLEAMTHPCNSEYISTQIFVSKLPVSNIWKQGSTEKGLIPGLLQGKIKDECRASCGTRKEVLKYKEHVEKAQVPT